MLFGVGIDLVEVDRIARVLERHGERFIMKVARDGEIRRPPGHPLHAADVAALFAAKEAVYKALRPDTLPIRFREVEIRHLPGGAPLVELHGRLAVLAENCSVSDFHISITHEKGMAAAVAVAMAGDP